EVSEPFVTSIVPSAQQKTRLPEKSKRRARIRNYRLESKRRAGIPACVVNPRDGRQPVVANLQAPRSRAVSGHRISESSESAETGVSDIAASNVEVRGVVSAGNFRIEHAAAHPSRLEVESQRDVRADGLHVGVGANPERSSAEEMLVPLPMFIPALF